MKTIAFLFIWAALSLTFLFAQKLEVKQGIGFSLRPSLYQHAGWFGTEKVFDIAPAIHYERYTKKGFFAKINLQYRYLKKEFEVTRNYWGVGAKTSIRNSRYNLLIPAVLIGWRRKIDPQKSTISPFFNLGLTQSILLRGRTQNAFKDSESGDPIIHTARLFDNSYAIGAGLNYPLNRNWIISLEAQFIRPFDDIYHKAPSDIGLVIGTTYNLKRK